MVDDAGIADFVSPHFRGFLSKLDFVRLCATDIAVVPATYPRQN